MLSPVSCCPCSRSAAGGTPGRATSCPQTRCAAAHPPSIQQPTAARRPAAASAWAALAALQLAALHSVGGLPWAGSGPAHATDVHTRSHTACQPGCHPPRRPRPPAQVNHWSRREHDNFPVLAGPDFGSIAPPLPEGWQWCEAKWHLDLSGQIIDACDPDGWSYGALPQTRAAAAPGGRHSAPVP